MTKKVERLITIFLSIILAFSLVGCKGDIVNSTVNNTLSKTEAKVENEKIIQYIPASTSYEQGVWTEKFYYSRWLNLYFAFTKYKSDNIDITKSYNNSKHNDNEIIEMECKEYCDNPNISIGIYVKKCNGKNLEQMIKKDKNSLSDTINEYSGDEVEWKPDSNITLCNQEYTLLEGEISGLHICKLCRIKGDRFIIIQINAKTYFSNTLELVLSMFKEFSEFDTIRFGNYEQDNNTSNGKEKIEWYVLEKQDNKALVISEYALDYKAIQSPYEENFTYATSSLRKWLNEDFLNNAFNTEEQSKIIMSSISSDDSSENAVQDKIFLLSHSDFEKYFPLNCSAICKPTKYLYSIDSYSKDNTQSIESCNWWLRTPQTDSKGYFYYIVTACNTIDSIHGKFFNQKSCVRPAMWVSLE